MHPSNVPSPRTCRPDVGRQSLARLSGLAVIPLLFVACDVPQRPQIGPPENPPPSTANVLPAEETEDAGSKDFFTAGWESWDLYEVDGKTVGFNHTLAEASEAKSASEEGRVRYTVQEQLQIPRGKATIVQRLEQSSTESDRGVLIGFESKLQVGPALTTETGSVDQGTLLVERVHAATTTSRRLPWQETYRGLVAVEQSLRNDPMQPGQSRTIRALLPIKHALATVRLYCVGEATIPMRDGQQKPLLEINRETSVDGEILSEAVLWTDAEGRVLRTLTPSLNLISYRVARQDVKAEFEAFGEQWPCVSVEVDGMIQRPEDVKRMGFRVTPLAESRPAPADTEPAENELAETGQAEGEPPADASASEADSLLISPAPGQWVRRNDAGELNVLVSRGSEQSQQPSRGFLSDQSPQQPGDLKQTAILNFRSPNIRKLAAAAIASRDMADEMVAIELAKTTQAMLQLDGSTSGFRRASEVELLKTGDTTDYAVLLAALLRAKGIPSRVALGLKYQAGDKPAMVYHAWTLAYVSDQWMSFDALDGGQANPDRLTILTTDLNDANPQHLFARYLNIVGNIQIQAKAQY